MVNYEYRVSNEHNIYPNLTVYDRLVDGALNGWKVTANEGYVFYDENSNDVELDPETMKEVSVKYYYTIKMLNPHYNWNNFALIAVLRKNIEEKYIF